MAHFDLWLGEKLDSLGLDAEVYLEYLTGILSDDAETLESKAESLTGIIQGATGGEQDSTFVLEMCERWTSSREANDGEEVRLAAQLMKISIDEVCLRSVLLNGSRHIRNH
jgi:hypothetical protein